MKEDALGKGDPRRMHFLKEAMKEDVSGIKEDVPGVMEDVYGVKDDVPGVKEKVFGVKDDVPGVKENVPYVPGIKENVYGVKEDVPGKGDHVGECCFFCPWSSPPPRPSCCPPSRPHLSSGP